MKSDSILVVGTGALGTLFAARFAAAGIPVTILGTWPAGLAALREEGVREVGMSRAFHIHVTDNPAECTGMNLALVLVKSWQTERAAQQLAVCLTNDGLAISLQNGLGNDRTLVRYLSQERVAQGVTTLGANLISPGIVCPAGEGTVDLETHPRLAPLEKMMHQAGFFLNIRDDVQSLVWGKLVISSAINPITALLRIKNGELLKHPSARELVGELATETSTVAKNLGIALPYTDPVLATEEIAAKTAENLSSMLQDMLRGRQTEIDAINGAIVRLADQSRLNAFYNRTFWLLLKAMHDRGNIMEQKEI
jgi:2-dehydropantoate 2-reductase